VTMPVGTAWPVFKHLTMIVGIETSPLFFLLLMSEASSFSLQLANSRPRRCAGYRGCSCSCSWPDLMVVAWVVV
jgi:hypothetical protein